MTANDTLPAIPCGGKKRKNVEVLHYFGENRRVLGGKSGFFGETFQDVKQIRDIAFGLLTKKSLQFYKCNLQQAITAEKTKSTERGARVEKHHEAVLSELNHLKEEHVGSDGVKKK